MAETPDDRAASIPALFAQEKGFDLPYVLREISGPKQPDGSRKRELVAHKFWLPILISALRTPSRYSFFKKACIDGALRSPDFDPNNGRAFLRLCDAELDRLLKRPVELHRLLFSVTTKANRR